MAQVLLEEKYEAVKALNWKRPYHLDADHINLGTVGRFIESCDFYTIDVADWIGKPADKASIDDFAGRHPELTGDIYIPGVASPFRTTHEFVAATAGKYLAAVEEAGKIYRHIEEKKQRSIHHGSIDGRNRLTANSRRVADYSGGHR